MDLNYTDDYTYEYNYLNPDFYQSGYTTENKVDIAVYSVLLYLGVCLNIWMLWTLYKTWERGSKRHFYLLSICIADLLYLTVICSYHLGIVVTMNWTAGNVGCKIFSFFKLSGAYLAHLLLAGFNIDNVVVVTCGRSVKALRLVFLIIAVVMSAIFCGPSAYFYKTVSIGYKSVIEVCSTQATIYVEMGQSVGYIWLPLLVIIFCGVPALIVWCSKRASASHQNSKNEDMDVDARNAGGDIGIMISYNIVFVVCWLPQAVVTTIFSWNTIGLTVVATIWMYKLMFFLTISSTVFNPIGYGIFYCINKRRPNSTPGL